MVYYGDCSFIDATVSVVEHLGDQAMLYFDVDGEATQFT